MTVKEDTCLNIQECTSLCVSQSATYCAGNKWFSQNHRINKQHWL